MNLPNKLTLGRIILVPLMVAALLIDFPFNNLVALIIFAAASITDLLDGKIARKQNLVTDFGKFADPLADKILVLATLLCFVQNGYCDCVAVIIVLFREFSVTSIRLIAASSGEVIAANIWGKAKTVSQMIAVIAILVMQFILNLANDTNLISAQAESIMSSAFGIAGEVLVWISTVFAVISGVIYIVQNRNFISET
ncbi:MAG: CDP-diacylglycerol--glycerol-3-phosphate 3-phosphatidyltransferase [Ruminococcus bromii]|nr:CDP-diacylglycerol--glycerol-3-phosphate 3-phosphatidyltransferase [Ruminococcus bromii]MCI7212498.1 CDP-diacylglycerol--glycerol-3-phosphate 3-phosphatidyltransferase [Ruminococcus bromii]MDD6433026.1 CDP-diacylglycerol--glycerol-3-phosphate 3-phosphatidyltransferase [Ruminococcus bromii]MDY4710687.1 CDP-diacylglycerol--glycerol-3-phosphate 3-phosphatidyltransferase [Ruminococcus bromii]